MSTADRSTHRTRLLQAARELLRERDYGAITARDLVATSNTNLGSIGYHFGSMEALLNEAVGLAFEEWTDAVIRLLPSDTTGGGPELISSLQSVLEDYDAIRPYHRAYIEALARSARSPELNRQLAEHYNRQRDRITAWITDSLGAPADSAHTRHFASLVIALVDGLLIQTFIDPAGAPTGQNLTDAIRGASSAANRGQ